MHEKLSPSFSPEFGLEAEVLLATVLRFESPAVRLAARQVRDELQVGGGDQVGVGEVGSCGRLDAPRAKFVGDEVEGALVNLRCRVSGSESGQCHAKKVTMDTPKIRSTLFPSLDKEFQPSLSSIPRLPLPILSVTLADTGISSAAQPASSTRSPYQIVTREIRHVPRLKRYRNLYPNFSK